MSAPTPARPAYAGRLAGHGFAVTLPERWEARIFRRDAPGTTAVGGAPGERAFPVVHLANFALPTDRGDYGSGAVETMTAADAFVAVVEFGPECAGTALFPKGPLPVPAPGDFVLGALQHRIRGQAGFQRFATVNGRALCVYAVLGVSTAAAALTPAVRGVLASVQVNPAVTVTAETPVATVPAPPRGTVTERFVGWLSRRLSPAPEQDATPGPPRRSFLGGAALVGAAVAASPWGYLTRPANAYDAICGSGATCNDGWSVFCCTVNGGQNTCPPDSFIGGWWKADHSSFCGGSARYYVDCNAYRDGAWQCRCNQTTCDQRLVACNQFRYGQCNLQVPYANTGPVVCRVVSCTPPWVQFGGVCTSSSATDNNTATHSAPCLVTPPPAAPAPRVVTVGDDAVAQVKAGPLDAPWVVLAGDVAAAAVTADRIGVLGTDGLARVKEGDVTAAWVVLASDTAALDLDGTRVAVLGTDGVVRVKEGPLAARWVTLAGGATAVSVDGARVGVVQGGTAIAKEGPLEAPWVTLAPARSIVVEGYRVAVVDADGTLRVKDGALTAAWTTLATGVAAVSLDGTRVAALLTDGRLLVKEGALVAPWVTVATDVAQGRVRGDRIGVVGTDGVVRVKAGAVAAAWVTVVTGSAAVALS